MSHPAAPALADNSPAIVVAREQKRIGELGVVKARSAWMPNVNVSYVRTEVNGVKSNLVGVALSMPIQAGGVLGTYSADSQMVKLTEMARDTERKIELDTQRLNDMIQAGLAEVEGRRIAIEAAKLSVQANEKSCFVSKNCGRAAARVVCQVHDTARFP